MPDKADVLLTGGTVITMNADYELFDDGAVAIRGDAIVAVGPAEKLSSASGSVSMANWPPPTATPLSTV